MPNAEVKVESVNSQAGINLVNNDQINNGLLKKDEHIAVDTATIKVVNANVQGFADLKAAGLKVDLGGLGVLRSDWETISGMEDQVAVSLGGNTDSRGDTPEYGLKSVPVPIISLDSFLNLRRLEASRKMGTPLDTSVVEIATELVTRKCEDILFNGSDIKIDGASLYGYFSFPEANDAGTPSGAWSTPANVLTDVEEMLSMLFAARFSGPFTLYVANDLWKDLIGDYKTGSDRTVKERILAYAEIADIKFSSAIPAGKVCMVQLTKNVVDYVSGQDIKTIEYETKGGFQLNLKTYCALAPRLKADSEDHCGICILDGITA